MSRVIRSKSSCASIMVFLLAALLLASSAQAATASWSLTPSSYDFGAVEMGARSAPATFTLTNTGDVVLPPPRVGLEFERPEDREGPESGLFEDGAFDCVARSNFAPGESCTVSLVFQPVNRGRRGGTIRFLDPSEKVPPITATFSGLGIGPIVSFSPPTRNLTAAVNEGPSQPQVLTVANDGDADLSISGISLIGDNASHFAIVGGKCQPGATVAPGASCTIQVTYSPTVAGFLFGELKLTDNAAHGFQIELLQGVGAAPPSVPLAIFISRRPRKVSTKRAATFRFRLSGAQAQFVCKLDHRPFRACVSPTTYRNLPVGHHLFKVKTRSRTPGVSSAPAMASFQVIPPGAI